MALATEMRRVTQNIMAGHGERAQFREQFERMASEQRQRLDEFKNDLSRSVQSHVRDLEHAHSEMAEDIRDRLDETAKSRSRMAQEQRERLAAFADELHQSVQDHVRQIGSAQQKMAADIQHRLNDHSRTRHKMGKEQQKRLSQEHARVASDVQARLADIHSDHAEAQRIWLGMSAQTEKKRAQAGRAPAAVKQGPDDLTTISGIGAGRLQRLNEIGISTFAQLAQASPDRIREALGASARLVNVEDWIRQAQKRL